MDQLTNGALQFSSPTPHRAATSLQQAPLLSCSPLQLLASVIVTGFVPSLVAVSSSSCSRRFTSGDHDVSNDTRTTETKSPKRRPSNPLQMPENVAKFKACNISVYECIYIYITIVQTNIQINNHLIISTNIIYSNIIQVPYPLVTLSESRAHWASSASWLLSSAMKRRRPGDEARAAWSC